MIAVFACNRPDFLIPCLDSLDGEEVHVFVDAVDEEGPDVERICRVSGFPCHLERERKGLGFQRHKALQMFLDDKALGNYFMLCDEDVVFGIDAVSLLRNELDFWWAASVPVGMLCCGYQKKSKGWGIFEKDGHGIIKEHGGETVAMMPRIALEKTGNRIGLGMLGNTANLKNAMRNVGHGRAILVKPMPPVQHIGAFRTVLSPQWRPDDLLFRDLNGEPLNPRPELFDVAIHLDLLRG
jgi:hypothetical protein